MSLPTGATRARPEPRERTPLSVVPPRVANARSGPFVLLVAAILAVGLVGLLLLNLSMQKGSFRLATLQDRAAALQTREQSLDLKVDRLSSSDRLAAEAIRMGMVPNRNPVFLDLSDGSVIGDPVAAHPRVEPVETRTDGAATTNPDSSATDGGTEDTGDPTAAGGDASGDADAGGGEPEAGTDNDRAPDSTEPSR